MNNSWDETVDITEIVDKKSYLLRQASEFEMVDEKAELNDEELKE